ncbi:MAG: peptidylprolyl isomerase [Euryarchaeota archaeon]|nr:peptidylprolyl isomerase [Euryarchaeota archaeon]
MKAIEKGDTVSVMYTGSFDDGEVFDTNVGGEPLSFVVGESEVIDGFEKAVVGKRQGDLVKARLEPKDAYGEADPRMVQTVPRDSFGDRVPSAGQQVSIRDEEGRVFTARVVEVADGSVKLDFNHPMANRPLNFEIEIVDVDPASA